MAGLMLTSVPLVYAGQSMQKKVQSLPWKMFSYFRCLKARFITLA